MTEDKTSADVFDAIVIGSGAAGMTCALTAADAGLSVLVLEKSHLLGGTSAMSGAGMWVPANHLAAEAGINDSAAEALAYIEAALGPAKANRHRPLWKALADNAGPMLRLVERTTPLRFALTPEPDPVDAAGAKARGRMVSPLALAKRVAGRFARRLRPSTLPHLFTYHDMFWPNPWKRPLYSAFAIGPTLLKRLLTGERGQGSALMAGLIAGCLEHGVEVRTEQTVAALVRRGGRVDGVRLANGRAITARRGVLIATGGFEWNRQRYERHFPGPTDWLTTPDTNTGGGLDLAETVGAAIDQMDQANIHPALPVRYEGRAHGMPVAWHVGPNAIVVNGQAERFCSEYDYNLGAALDRRDDAGQPVNLPAWLVCDRRFLWGSLPFAFYALKARNWVRRARSLTELARTIGLAPEALEATVTRYNGFVQNGRDDDFHRGEAPWERFRAGSDRATANPALGTIERAPFYAIPVNRSILGTKGGPITDAEGQVLDTAGERIPGLYAAGNAMANSIGTRVVGAGTTIGPHMTMGYVCGLSMAGKTTSAIVPPAQE
ncbi:MAG: FAD-dependent oxidoreductase [Azospirillaceae bacterium]|nr:FAD-dependent oxidoreductase [Azospirillaceae bacterium]